MFGQWCIYNKMKKFRLCIFLTAVLLITGCSYKGDRNDTFKEEKENRIIQVIPEKPVRIELKRNSRGAYSWTLKGENPDKLIEVDKKLNAYIRSQKQ